MTVRVTASDNGGFNLSDPDYPGASSAPDSPSSASPSVRIGGTTYRLETDGERASFSEMNSQRSNEAPQQQAKHATARTAGTGVPVSLSAAQPDDVINIPGMG